MLPLYVSSPGLSIGLCLLSARTLTGARGKCSGPLLLHKQMEFPEFSAVPVQQLSIGGFRVDMLRTDQLHPHYGGNKWFKLKYNLQMALARGYEGVLSAGGPWSNHLHALAYAGKDLGLRTIGLVRGEEPARWSDTLRDCRSCGMELVFVSREFYRLLGTEDMKAWIRERFGHMLVVPEGGSNFAGINGCMELVPASLHRSYDLVVLAAGTGATAAGLRLSLPPSVRIWAIPVLKGVGYMAGLVENHLTDYLGDREVAAELMRGVHVDERWHFGGYGRFNEDLLSLIRSAQEELDLPLDQVYTGKMWFGLLRMILNDEMPANTRVLAIHTGGLQGKRSLKW